MKKLSILIPCYNEKDTIKEILKKIEEVILPFGMKKEIIITDGTKEILKSLENKYKIVYHSKNRDEGFSVRTGLKHATGDFIIIQDADLEYDPKDYCKLLECAVRNNGEAVYGSRQLNHQNKYSGFFII